MTDDGCDEMHLLIQADVDGELQPAEAARVGVHLTRCADCSALQARLLALGERVRAEASSHPASAALRARIGAQIAAARPAARPTRRLGRAFVPGATFGAGFALAACLALALLLPRAGDLQDAVVASHIRALQPGHLMDVVSTDQHTVKPWFDGRLPFAPPVKDLAAQGFPLIGGRLDYLAGRTAAALVYRHGQHVIDLYAWPSTGEIRLPTDGSVDGYNFVSLRQDGMVFWAVSDLAAPDLVDFVHRWQAS
jgi:anti-sigma factor RsiW